MSEVPVIVTLDAIEGAGEGGNLAALRVTGTFTPGVAVTELQFPANNVSMVSPGLGYLSVLIRAQGRNGWSSPVFVRLTRQILTLPEYDNRPLQVALIPFEGCTLEVEGTLTRTRLF